MSLFPPLVPAAVAFVLFTDRDDGVQGERAVFAEVEMLEVVLLLKDVEVVMVVPSEEVSTEDAVEDEADKVQDADTAVLAVLVAVVVDNDDDEGMLDDEVMVEGAVVEDDDEGEGAETVVVVEVPAPVAAECGVVVEGLLSNSIPLSSSSFNRSRKISCDWLETEED